MGVSALMHVLRSQQRPLSTLFLCFRGTIVPLYNLLIPGIICNDKLKPGIFNKTTSPHMIKMSNSEHVSIQILPGKKKCSSSLILLGLNYEVNLIMQYWAPLWALSFLVFPLLIHSHYFSLSKPCASWISSIVALSCWHLHSSASHVTLTLESLLLIPLLSPSLH